MNEVVKMKYSTLDTSLKNVNHFTDNN